MPACFSLFPLFHIKILTNRSTGTGDLFGADNALIDFEQRSMIKIVYF